MSAIMTRASTLRIACTLVGMLRATSFASATLTRPDMAHGKLMKAVAAPQQNHDDAIMLQGFGWASCSTPGGFYNAMRARVPAIKEAGISHVWLPPPSQSVSPQGYMPSQLYNLNSEYGSKVELQTLIDELSANSIESLADIVINHRCADEQSDGIWNVYHDDVDHRGRRLDWKQWAVTGDDPSFRGQGNFDTGEDFGAAPDLDHTNPEVNAALQDWLGWLQTSIGFTGWRFDFIKGYQGDTGGGNK